MLELKIARNSPFEKEAILVKEALASQCESIALNSHFVLHVNEEIYLFFREFRNFRERF